MFNYFCPYKVSGVQNTVWTKKLLNYLEEHKGELMIKYFF